MKQVGIVKDYNGYNGKIITNEKDYLLMKKDIVDQLKKLNNNDVVEFVPDKYDGSEVTKDIARFVRKKEPKK